MRQQGGAKGFWHDSWPKVALESELRTELEHFEKVMRNYEEIVDDINKKFFVDATPLDRLHASKILTVVKRHHLVLCTLLISNAAAMEALPIFFKSLVPDWAAIVVSVTLILMFGEIMPQSICARYGLVIGAAVVPLVRVLVWIWFPIAYPISKVLDLLLGKEHVSLYRRAELKTLIDFHSNKAGKRGDLSLYETTIIVGALELTEKTAKDAMTPLLFAGMMSGLTLGLMSMSLVDLEVLAKSAKILTVVKRHHLVLCTLLISNAAAMEVLQPSKELDRLIERGNTDDGLGKCIITDICKAYDLNTMDVLKYQQQQK